MEVMMGSIGRDIASASSFPSKRGNLSEAL